MNEHICPSCGEAMTLQKETRAKLRNQFRRVRRYYCDTCDISETLYGTGYNQVVTEPRRAIRDVEGLYGEWDDAESDRIEVEV